MINDFGHSPTRSENVYFANNEKLLIAVFTAVFCFTHAEHNSIKLINYIIIDRRKLLTVFWFCAM